MISPDGIRRGCVAILVAFVATCSCPAQKSRTPKPQSVTGTGKVLKADGGMLQVQDSKSGDLWLLKPGGPTTEITFAAKASKAWLQRKMLIRIEGVFDRKGVGVDPVTKILVFTPRPEYRIGVFSEAGEPVRIREDDQSLMVAGVVTRIEDGTVRLSTGRRTFTVELSEKVEVDVDFLGDLSWVRPGDEVKYSAKYFNKGLGLASKLNVVTKQLLEPPVKKRRVARRRGGKSDSVSDETAAEEPSSESTKEPPSESEGDPSDEDESS